jgi:uncharacterized membrane protein YhaH (DUF805 family)
MPLVIPPKASDLESVRHLIWGPAMNLKTLLFGFEGRINRAKWWLTILIIAIVWIVAGIIGAILWAILGETIGLVVAGLIGLATVVLVLWASIATGLKRLHDREKPGWWLLIFWLLPFVLNLASIPMAGSMAGNLLALVGFGISVWAVIELGALKGTTGPNKYGPDPLPPVDDD